MRNGNWIINEGSPEKVIDDIKAKKAVEGAEECPLERPFYANSESKCIACPQDQYFNFDESKC